MCVYQHIFNIQKNYNAYVYIYICQWFIGGGPAKRQMVEYNIDNDNITDKGANKFTKDVNGFGQHYTQVKEQLYMINTIGSIM